MTDERDSDNLDRSEAFELVEEHEQRLRPQPRRGFLRKAVATVGAALGIPALAKEASAEACIFGKQCLNGNCKRVYCCETYCYTEPASGCDDPDQEGDGCGSGRNQPDCCEAVCFDEACF